MYIHCNFKGFSPSLTVIVIKFLYMCTAHYKMKQISNLKCASSVELAVHGNEERKKIDILTICCPSGSDTYVIIIPHACTRGKAIGSVCLSSICTKSPDLKIQASWLSVSAIKYLEVAKNCLLSAS